MHFRKLNALIFLKITLELEIILSATNTLIYSTDSESEEPLDLENFGSLSISDTVHDVQSVPPQRQVRQSWVRKLFNKIPKLNDLCTRRNPNHRLKSPFEKNAKGYSLMDVYISHGMTSKVMEMCELIATKKYQYVANEYAILLAAEKGYWNTLLTVESIIFLQKPKWTLWRSAIAFDAQKRFYYYYATNLIMALNFQENSSKSILDLAADSAINNHELVFKFWFEGPVYASNYRLQSKIIITGIVFAAYEGMLNLILFLEKQLDFEPRTVDMKYFFDKYIVVALRVASLRGHHHVLKCLLEICKKSKFDLNSRIGELVEYCLLNLHLNCLEALLGTRMLNQERAVQLISDVSVRTGTQEVLNNALFQFINSENVNPFSVVVYLTVIFKNLMAKENNEPFLFDGLFIRLSHERVWETKSNEFTISDTSLYPEEKLSLPHLRILLTWPIHPDFYKFLFSKTLTKDLLAAHSKATDWNSQIDWRTVDGALECRLSVLSSDEGELVEYNRRLREPLEDTMILAECLLGSFWSRARIIESFFPIINRLDTDHVEDLHCPICCTQININENHFDPLTVSIVDGKPFYFHVSCLCGYLIKSNKTETLSATAQVSQFSSFLNRE